MVKTGKAKVKIGKISVKTGKKSVSAVEENNTTPPPLSLPEGCLVSSERPSDTAAASMLVAKGDISERESVDDDDMGKLDYEREASDTDDENRGEAKASGSSNGVPEGMLVPGPCLQHCSGADVQLARGAGARPNLAKGKGRFLIVLPGMMSLKPPQSKDKPKNTTKSVTQDSAPSVNLETMTSTLTQDTSDGGNEDDESNNDVKPTTTKPSVPTLGKIEQLGSDSPTLNIPFEDGRILSFHGKKVESSSKFMALTCNSRKKTVTCKDIFSSVIVFGDGKWQKAGGVNVAETTELSQSADTADTPPLTHFGGSRRALDGGKNVGGSKKVPRLSSYKRKSGGLKGTIKAAACEEIDVSAEEDEESDDDEVELLLDDEDDDEEEYVDRSVVNVALDGNSKRTRPSRRSASKSKVNYAELAGGDSEKDSDEDAEETVDVQEEDENDANSSEDQAPAKRKASRRSISRKQKQESDVQVVDVEESIEKDPDREKTATGTEATSHKRKQQSARKTNSRKRKQESEDEEVFAMLRDDEDEEYVEGNVSAQDDHAKKQRASRRSTSKRKVNYADLVVDEEESSDDDTDNVEEEEYDGSCGRRATPAKTKNMAKSTSRKRKQVTDREVIEIEIEKENKDENTTKPPSPENGQTNRTSISRSRKEESDVEVVDIDGSENYKMNEIEKATSARKAATRTKLASSSSEKAGCVAKATDAVVLDGRTDDGLSLGVENEQVNKAGKAMSPDRKSIGSWMGSAKKSPRRRRRATPNKNDDGSASTSTKSPVRRKLDISNDDEFDFLG